jgi:PAS domain S-box-containing protein
MGDRRTLYFHELAPGSYVLTVKAANNDEVWNSAGVGVNFKVEPFLWQTMAFRGLVLAMVAGFGGVTAWRLTHNRLKQRIATLEQHRALEKERARLASVMEATSDLVAFADNEGNILHINPAGRKLLGLPANGGAPGLKLADLQPRADAQRVANEGIPAARQRGTWEAETALLHRDGREIPVSQVIMAHKDPSGRDNFLSTIARDITERKQAEQEGTRLRSQLLQAQKMESVGRLAGGIAHDFNNMLQVILGNAALAIEQAQPGSLLHTELLGIQKSANRSAALTRQLLTFARKQNVSPGVLDLNETVGGMLQMLQRLIGENIQLIWKPGPNLWPVKLDPAQIDQILANLAINARDAIRDQGKLTIETSNTVLDESSAHISVDFVPGDYVLLSVTDTGMGMTKEVLEHLFEPFFTTKEIGHGTGLGLAMVFGIVKQNKGLIHVVSAPDQGATFKIYFPRTEVAEKTEKTATPVAGPPRGTETILLVEDEEEILELGGKCLERCGYKILLAASPGAALKLAAQHTGKIDLLITDMVMPGMSGKELKEKLESTQRSFKTLFMSGYTADDFAHKGAPAPKSHFLQKPFSFEGLAQKVRDLLDSREG